jgi:hypothetical protein
MFIVTVLLLDGLKKYWCQLPEDGENITNETFRSYVNFVSINYRKVHFCMLHDLPACSDDHHD